MKDEYIVTEQYLSEKGLNMSEYVLEDIYTNAIIHLGLDLLIDRICHLDDEKSSEEDIELALDKEPQKVSSFLKAQYRVIYNLIFQAETSPVDPFIDSIIAHQLGWGKINGWQKGLYYKNN